MDLPVEDPHHHVLINDLLPSSFVGYQPSFCTVPIHRKVSIGKEAVSFDEFAVMLIPSQGDWTMQIDSMRIFRHLCDG